MSVHRRQLRCPWQKFGNPRKTARNNAKMSQDQVRKVSRARHDVERWAPPRRVYGSIEERRAEPLFLQSHDAVRIIGLWYGRTDCLGPPGSRGAGDELDMAAGA